MKKIITILTVCLLTFAGTQSAQAQLLSENFYKQFKTLLETDFNDLKVDSGLSPEDYSTYETFKCSKTLDGFKLEMAIYEDELFYSETLYGNIFYDKNAVQIFEEIIEKVRKLEESGYSVTENISSYFPSDAQKGIEISKGKVNATFYLLKNTVGIKLEIEYLAIDKYE